MILRQFGNISILIRWECNKCIPVTYVGKRVAKNPEVNEIGAVCHFGQGGKSTPLQEGPNRAAIPLDINVKGHIYFNLARIRLNGVGTSSTMFFTYLFS